jgi:hypothetical protein
MTEIRVVGRPEPLDAEGTPAVSVVVTLYNEAATVDDLYRRSAAALEGAGLRF